MFADSLTQDSDHKKVVEITLKNTKKLFPIARSFVIGQMTPYTFMCPSHYLSFMCDALNIMAHSIDSFVTY